MVAKFYHTYKEYYRSILKLSYPIVVGQLGIVLMGVADVIMVGKVGPAVLAAAAFANAIYFIVSILGIGTLSAVAPLVAKAKGAEKPNEAALLFRQGINAALLLSVFICSLILLLTFNLHWFGQEPEVTTLAKDFLHLLNLSNVFMLLYLAAKQFSDGLSITKPSAVIMVLALGINILLNWFFIYGNMGMPKLGLTGAGLSTLIARVFMAVAMFTYVFTRKAYKPYLHVKDKTEKRGLLKEIFRVGLPSGLQYVAEMGAFGTSAIIIGTFGHYELAAHQVAINIASVTYMIATGISAGGSIAVGDALGRKNKPDLVKAGRAALVLGAVFMAACALLFATFNEFIVWMYTDDAIVTGMATKLLLIAALFQLSDGVQCVGLGVLRGLADTKIPTAVTIIAYWIIGIPAGLWMARALDLSLYGIWFGLSVGLTFAAVLLTRRFLKTSKAIDFIQDEKEHYGELIKE